MSSPTADVSCRVAWADDAPAIARLQLRTRKHDLADMLPAEELEADPAVAEEAWRRLLTRPPDARLRVLVALERNRVVGFAITSPATDPDTDPIADAELMELTVDPEDRGRGHGSRLLQAAIDTITVDRFRRAVCWVVASDDDLPGLRLPGVAIKLSETPGTVRTPPPRLGEHTDEILTELGYDGEAIADFRTRKVV